MKQKLALIVMGAIFATSSHAAMSVRDFFKQNEFGDVEISPTGEFIAVTMPTEESTNLVVLRMKDKKIHGVAKVLKNKHIGTFAWVNDTRLAFTMSDRIGKLVRPQANGALYFMNADGKKAIEVGGARQNQLLDTLMDDDEHVIIASYAASGTLDGNADSWIYRVNVNTGKMKKEAMAPVVNAGFTLDNKAQPRLVQTTSDDMIQTVYERDVKRGEWRKIHDEKDTDTTFQPLAYDPANEGYYAQLTEKSGPDSIYYFKDGKRELYYRDELMNPMQLIQSPLTHKVLGVVTMPDRVRNVWLDDADEEVKMRKGLEQAFPDSFVSIDSVTKDGKQWIVTVRSDRDPGQFFLFDKETSKVSYLLSRQQWVEPKKMAEMKQVTIEARDGLKIRGFLSLPPGSDGKNLPFILNPHGGPHGPFDIWGYNDEIQLFTSRGYAVLQVNYRGSGGYGQAFERMGYREWSGKMQDDLVDATKWAVAQGIADDKRKCIYGGSYGGYAALVGGTRDADLYQCVIGFVGVYDLHIMYKRGDIPERESGVNYLKRVLGKDDAELTMRSPAQQASKAKAPIYIAAGGADRRCPPAQSEEMVNNLKKAGKDVEYDVTPGEGHGFYRLDNNEKLYTKFLAHLEKTIGKGKAVN